MLDLWKVLSEVCACHWLLHFCCHFFWKFVHATNCYIFVIRFLSLCMLLIIAFSSLWKHVVGSGKNRKPGLSWSMCMSKRLGLAMWLRHQNYMDACFQAPHCCTQTMTNGNTPCSLINLVFQLFVSSKPYIQENCWDVHSNMWTFEWQL